MPKIVGAFIEQEVTFLVIAWLVGTFPLCEVLHCARAP